jgi:signal transduction histidine kinase
MFHFKFDPINISLLLTALLNFLLGALIFVSGKRKIINIVYGLNIVAIIGWIMAMFFYRSAPPELNMLWCTVLYVVPTLIASSFLYFTYIFPTQKEKSVFWQTALIFGINLALVIAIIWPDFMIKAVNVRPGQEKQIIFSGYYWFYFLYTFFFFSFGFFRLIRKYSAGKGIERLQILYLVSGYALAANSAFVTNLVMPWLGYFSLNWLGQVLTCIMVAFTAYAILRYRLMDIRIVFRKAMVFLLSSAFVYGAFYLIIWIDEGFFGGVRAEGAYLFGLLAAPLFILMFVWANERIKGIANRYLFSGLHSIQETMNKLSGELVSSIDLGRITDSIVNSIKNTMQLNRAGIVLVDSSSGIPRYEVAKMVGFGKSGLGWVQDDLLINYLETMQKPVVSDELAIIAKNQDSAEKMKDLESLVQKLRRMGISLCLPLIISDKMIGMIVLGDKISGDAYTSEDLNLLDTLSKQASIAVENAQLYREVQDFSKTLEQRVAAQTREIREQKDKIERSLAVEKQAHDLEKHVNEELRHLDASKTDFMFITQHHLRTPLSVNAGLIDLVLDGAYGKPPKKMKDTLIRLKESNQKEIDVVNELLDVSSYEIGKETVHLDKAIDFSALMEETLKDLRIEAKNKGIYLKYKQLGPIPEVNADRLKMKMVLTNVIDNCIKYTAKGGVTVAMGVADGKLRIDVADTGIGLSEEVIKHLFKRPFERGEMAQRMFAVGRGLGLFLSAKIVEGHHGRIWAESKGNGKGSAFHIELPMIQTKP